jgi:hypothetical protein
LKDEMILWKLFKSNLLFEEKRLEVCLQIPSIPSMSLSSKESS